MRFSLLPLAGLLLAGCSTAPNASPLAQTAPPSSGENPVLENPVPPAAPGVYDISEVEVIPVAISQPLPLYPFELRRALVTGSATILFTVRKDGSVADAMVRQATLARFGAEALKAVRQWKFRPASVGGQPVDCRLLVPMTFSL